MINALADTTIVRTSDKPGLTQQINFFAAGRVFNMIDMPGYGFAYSNEQDKMNWKQLVCYNSIIYLRDIHINSILFFCG